jgi:hypothetical protein
MRGVGRDGDAGFRELATGTTTTRGRIAGGATTGTTTTPQPND